jgi:hypothetical protein
VVGGKCNCLLRGFWESAEFGSPNFAFRQNPILLLQAHYTTSLLRVGAVGELLLLLVENKNENKREMPLVAHLVSLFLTTYFFTEKCICFSNGIF